MKKFLDIQLPTESKEEVLEKIIKYTNSQTEFVHVVSLNPEIFIISRDNKQFKQVVTEAQIKIIDGVGVAAAARLLGIDAGPRIPGVDLLHMLLDHAGKGRLGVVLLGGKGKLAERLAECQSKLYPEAKFIGLEGIRNISDPTQEEEDKIFSIIADTKPHMLFVAFGSPFQELWIEKHKEKLQGVVCMGVGGGFDFLTDDVRRAPGLLRTLGLEWLYRLVKEPWRWRRQTRLISFIWLVMREKFRHI